MNAHLRDYFTYHTNSIRLVLIISLLLNHNAARITFKCISTV
ncbi:unnamed protein product [Schistosoma margrebowiei]|uniref:Uncharacterized protein n=1 Tax=Schistosoma margrebowiei TaxID=48269 RepID=A0A3P7ZU13_9TREM|nr:unnamed protein product [Schistosoma margrebowiei]